MATKVLHHASFWTCELDLRRSRWPRRLKRGSAAARLLGLQVRIPPGAWTPVSFECCVLSGRCLCDWPVPHSELRTLRERNTRLVCAHVRVRKALVVVRQNNRSKRNGQTDSWVIKWRCAKQWSVNCVPWKPYLIKNFNVTELLNTS
jgi:hypothetical protein